MIKTDTLTARSGEAQQKDWQLLFDMIPAIDAKKKFGTLMGSKKMPNGNFSLPFWLEDELVSKFFNTVYFLGIIVVFDWASWQQGMDILNDPETDYQAYDLQTLCKLMTVIVRSDKFCEGYLINCFESGTMVRVIEALQSRVAERRKFDDERCT